MFASPLGMKDLIIPLVYCKSHNSWVVSIICYLNIKGLGLKPDKVSASLCHSNLLEPFTS